MSHFPVFLTIAAFLLTMVLLFWRPKGLNEAIPASIGAFLVLISGSVTLGDLGTIISTIGEAAITILATMVMANVFGSFGFFQWAAEQITSKAKGNGIRLFWLINLLCFLMTLFFNNDGSILITTPILLILLKNLGLKPQQQIPYLLSGALIATASSAPIGVSNIVNLVALKIVGMSLYTQAAMMFVPATLGLLLMVCLLYLIYRKQLVKTLPSYGITNTQIPVRTHPLKKSPQLADRSNLHPKIQALSDAARTKFMRNIFIFVIGVRVCLFIASYFGVSVSLTAVLGSVVLLIWRWWYLKVSPADIAKKTPWYILVFAFSMYVVIYGLHKIGLSHLLISYLEPYVQASLLHASFLMGGLVSVMSDLFCNHPALMIGTLALTTMHLDPIHLKLTYLANVIGSDMGSLLMPIGTLATLMWMHICRKQNVIITWKKYVQTTAIVIPISVVFTLFALYFWVSTFFQTSIL